MAGYFERKTVCDIDLLLQPFGGDNPCGENLRYDPVYDQIRDARREDDHTMSRGVWQFELKRADWPTVESLCYEALTTRSKDLQIAGWLAESWAMMDDLPGMTRGLDLVNKYSQTFWDNAYPLIPDGDLDYRLQYFDWLDRTLANRFVLIPFLSNDMGDTDLTFADWMAAVRLDTVSRRTPDGQRIVDKAEAKGQLTLKRFQTAMFRVSFEDLEEKLNNVNALNDTFRDLKNTLDAKIEGNTLAFEELQPRIDDMIRVVKSEYAARKKKKDEEAAASEAALVTATEGAPEGEEGPADVQLAIGEAGEGGVPPSVSGSAPISGEISRQQAYQRLSEIAELLERLEPHSPAPQILRKVIQWENKSLMDIFNELGSAPEDVVALMRFLGIGGSKAA